MNPLHLRSTSGFALSISTGFAMETLFEPRQEVFDPSREAPARIHIQAYNELWINVLTLIRNAYNGVDAATQAIIKPPDMVEVIHQEIDLIRDLLRIEGMGLCQPVFYFSRYDHIFRSFGRVFELRIDKTPLQLQARKVYLDTREVILKEDGQVRLFDEDLQPGLNKAKALIVTHTPADLLSEHRFGQLDLLESHTGVVKPKFEWHTKYHQLDDPGMKRLPFTRQLLYIFGDTSMIRPMRLTIRKKILEHAKTKRWTPAMSESTVRFQLQHVFHHDPLLAGFLRRV